MKYLSAYAHNDTMLVKEQQDIKAGQKIATMGSTGTSSTRLHFEIRYGVKNGITAVFTAAILKGTQA